ncbi:MAG: hypothetical protein LC128_00150 [Chitinophagales bacterium]|nr:hypothetical protein [Chitinophagales bacterium]
MNSLNKKESKTHIFIKLFSFLAILFLLDLAIGNVLRYYYFRQTSGLYYRTTYALDSTNADMLIFGASTANHHYVPVRFEDRLQLSCYNTGRDGNSIFYSFAVLQSILKRHKPRMVILDIYDREFKKDEKNYDRLSSLLPYYDKHPEIRPIVQLKGPYEKLKMFSKIYPFNSMLFTIWAGNSEFNKGRENIPDESGYVPLTSNWKGTLIIDSSSAKYETDTTMISVFRSFIKECVSKNIALYIFVSPKFVRFEKRDITLDVVEKIADEFKIPFYNFANDPFFLGQKDLYYDNSHLNAKGAEIFTDMVIDKIEKEK